VLHGGTYKTGSTHIQQTLRKHSSNLTIGGAPVFYMNLHYTLTELVHYSSRGLSTNYFTRYRGIKQDEILLKSAKQQKLIQACNSHIIGSSEIISGLSQANMEKLIKIFSCYDVYVVFFYRSHFLNVISRYSQYAKFLLHSQDFLHYYFYSNDKYMYPKQFEMYAKRFGRDHVKLIDYEHALHKNDDITNILLQSVGFNSLNLSISSMSRENSARVSIVVFEAFKHLNVYLASRYNCSLNLHPLNVENFLMINFTKLVPSLPTKCGHLMDMFVEESLQMKRYVDEHFSDMIHLRYNESFDRYELNKKSPLCTFDHNAFINHRKKWYKVFDAFYDRHHDMCVGALY
jgi:hypothetical protein